jgi:hypothetical protein
MNTVLAILGSLGGIAAFFGAVFVVVRAIFRQVRATEDLTRATEANTRALNEIRHIVDDHTVRLAVLENRATP